MNGVEQVGFATAVITDKAVDTGCELQRRCFVVLEKSSCNESKVIGLSVVRAVLRNFALPTRITYT